MERDLGEMAQSTLELWAAQENITANRSIKDREGWDYLLQFPQVQPPAGTPLDLRPARAECLLQVKGVGTSRQRKSITLSNWEKLIASALPAFFLILHFGDEPEPQRAFLVHVDSFWMEKVLKRLRTLTNEEKHRLSDLTLDLTWGESDALASLDGLGLKSAIERYVGSDFDAYVHKKQKQRGTIGLDARMRIGARPENIAEFIGQWVDLTIGVRDSLPLSDIVIEKQVRFGIPADRIEHATGELSIPDLSSHGKRVRFVIGNTAQTRVSEFAATLYTPVGFPPGTGVPKEHFKLRLQCEVGEFVFRPYEETQTINVNVLLEDIPRPRRLDELANLWRVITIWENAQSDGCFFEISDNRNILHRLNARSSFPREEEMHEIAEAVDQAWSLSKQLDIPAGTEVTLAGILNQKQVLDIITELTDVNVPLQYIRGIIAGEVTEMQIERAVILTRILSFGNLITAVFLGFGGPLVVTSATCDEKSFEIRNPRRVLQEYHRLSKADETEFRLMLDEVFSRLELKGFIALNRPG